MKFRSSFLLIFSIFLLTFPQGSKAGGRVEGGEPETNAPAEPEGQPSAPSMLESFARKLGFSRPADMDSGPPPSREDIEERLGPFLDSIIDTIIVTGNRYTHRKTIIREMATRQGERLDRDLIFRDDSYLRGLGFFSQVEITAEQADEGKCLVRVLVEERPGLFMKYPFPMINYRIDEGVSYGFRWRIRNFRGVGEEILMTYEERSGKERGGGATWYAPWVGGMRLRLYVNLFGYYRLEKPEIDDYIKQRSGGRVGIGIPLTSNMVRQIWFRPEFSVESRYSRMSIPGNINAPAGIFFRQFLMSYGAGLTVDSRDNNIAPMRGQLTSLKINRYITAHGHDQQYTFYRFISNHYFPLPRIGTIILASSADNRDGDLPSFFWMKLGGKNDLRGYGDDMQGRSKLINSIQWRKKIYGPRLYRIPWVGAFDLAVNAVAFIDNGALMESFDELSNARFHTSGGFGLEVLSPVQDLIRIEAAFSEGNAPTYYVTSNSRF